MKKQTYLLGIVMISLVLCCNASAGSINGRTFSSKFFKGVTISAPQNWLITDKETAKGDRSTELCEITPAVEKEGAQPECQFTLLEFVFSPKQYMKKYLIPNLDNRFKFSTFSTIKLDDKDAYQTIGTFTHKGVEIGMQFILITGETSMMQITTTDYHPVFQQQIEEMARSIDGL